MPGLRGWALAGVLSGHVVLGFAWLVTGAPDNERAAPAPPQRLHEDGECDHGKPSSDLEAASPSPPKQSVFDLGYAARVRFAIRGAQALARPSAGRSSIH